MSHSDQTITCTGTWGAELFGLACKKTLKISPVGIEWEGRLWPLESITRIRWGATKTYVNGISTGTIYTIAFGNDSEEVQISPRKAEVYENFTQCLWKAVGNRLIYQLLTGLQQGKEYQFSKALLRDHGMVLPRRKFLIITEMVFCPWSEIEIGNSPGFFHIGKKGDKQVSQSFSYENDYNTIILESAIRLFWNKGKDRISSALLSNQNKNNSTRNERDEHQECNQKEGANRSQTQRDSRLDDQKYAQVLGLKGRFGGSDVKHAYRDLIAKYHPDKVNHLGEEFQKLAREKTQEIITAYEYYRKKYNIT